MTKKFLNQWEVVLAHDDERAEIQRDLDGGVAVKRDRWYVMIGDQTICLDTPGTAVKFAAALNKLRRPLHLIKQDLDADWARRVKARDNNTCALCGVQGDKVNPKTGKKDVLTAHHWLLTKQRARMARWSTTCGVTVHYAEHIHTLHENPCWADMRPLASTVIINEMLGRYPFDATLELGKIEVTEARARALWLERKCWKKGGAE